MDAPPLYMCPFSGNRDAKIERFFSSDVHRSAGAIESGPLFRALFTRVLTIRVSVPALLVVSGRS